MKSVRRFPVALLRRLVLLPLCLLACSTAAAQSPEQEMEAEAKKLLPTLFTKSGEDYFSKRTFKYRSGVAYVIGQYKGVTARVQSQLVTRRDSQNGVQWKGNIRFTASTGREFPHGMQFVERGLNPQKLDPWSDWKPPNLAAYLFLVEKRNGVISVKRRTPVEIAGMECATIPQ
jgi:hypothetical protein